VVVVTVTGATNVPVEVVVVVVVVENSDVIPTVRDVVTVGE
jgi:hypothetical protein